MEIYRYGKIVHTTQNYIILDSNYTGWLFYVAKSERFKKDDMRKIYVYTHVNDYTKVSYGFDVFKEKILFEDLISVQGIGPKTALAMLDKGWEEIMKLIAQGNWEQLSKFPYVTLRSAKQAILEFQDKYQKFYAAQGEKILATPENNKVLAELENTLKILGFKKTQIDFALSKIEIQQDVEQMVENAIKLISNARELRTQT